MHDGVVLSVQMNTGTGMVWIAGIYPDSKKAIIKERGHSRQAAKSENGPVTR